MSDIRRNRITIESLMILASKTVIAYFTFFIFLFSVPVFNDLKAALVETHKLNDSRLVLGDATIKVGIADTPAERKKGLSGLKQLSDGAGLFFVFDDLDTHSIWMKDMNFAIDVIWLNSSKEVVHIVKNMTPDTYPTAFTPVRPALYILEVPAGFVEKWGIKIGDQATVL